jgi:hypothetical protein
MSRTMISSREARIRSERRSERTGTSRDLVLEAFKGLFLIPRAGANRLVPLLGAPSFAAVTPVLSHLPRRTPPLRVGSWRPSIAGLRG